MHRSYRDSVVADQKVRLARFTEFVNRAIRASGRGVEDLARAAGIGVNTLYLWRSGKHREFPQGETVRKFCVTVGCDPAAAFAILWPAEGAKAAATEPQDLEPEIVRLLQVLRAPKEIVSDAEKERIWRMIEAMAPARSDRHDRRRNDGEANDRHAS